MILGKETIEKYKVDPINIKKYSTQMVVAKCDICGIIFEKSSKKIFGCRWAAKNNIDTCGNKKCTRQKVRQTCLKKFGTEEAMSSIEIQNLSKKRIIEKYGVSNVFCLPEIKEKIKQTNLKKYGVEYSKSSDIVKHNTRKNNIQKYGVINPMILPQISQKVSITWCKKIYNEILKNTSIHPLFSCSEFIGFNKDKHYRFKCLKCKNEFENNYLGVQCYKCNPLPRSLIENELKEFVQSIYTGTIQFNCRKKFENKFEIDIYIPDKNIAIELNGNYYHSETSGNKSKRYHINKTEVCEKLGIHLIQIFEDEWINKRSIIKSKLLHILKINKTETSIYARKCSIKDISFINCCQFLNIYHIQGSDKSSIRIGAYYDNELIAAMTFGKLRKIMGYKNFDPNTYELIRFATSKKVVGIAGKLLSYFIKQYNPKKIVSYADRRWSNGNLYEKLKFKKVSSGVPNYWYVNKNNYRHRYHRFAFRKSELNKKLKDFNPNLTEWENMQLNGYDRIWDCGNLKYEMSLV